MTPEGKVKKALVKMARDVTTNSEMSSFKGVVDPGMIEVQVHSNVISARGGTNGRPDYTMMVGLNTVPVGFELEVKTEEGKLSDNQVTRIARTSTCANVIVVYGQSGVENLREFLNRMAARDQEESRRLFARRYVLMMGPRQHAVNERGRLVEACDASIFVM